MHVAFSVSSYGLPSFLRRYYRVSHMAPHLTPAELDFILCVWVWLYHVTSTNRLGFPMIPMIPLRSPYDPSYVPSL